MTTTTTTTTTTQEQQKPFLGYIASIVHSRVFIITYFFIKYFLGLQFNKSSTQVALTACSNGSVFITKVAFP